MCFWRVTMSLRWVFVVMVFALSGYTLPCPAADYTVWTTDAMTKVSRTVAPERINRVIDMSAARNEYESAQIVIRAGSEPLQQVKVTISDLIGPAGARIRARNVGLYRVAYVSLPIQSKEQPDPLPPLTVFDVPKDTNQPVWITVYVPKRQPAGEYTGEVRISSANATTTRVPVKLTVWNFELPDKPSTRSAFGLAYECIAKAHGVDPKSIAYRELCKRYYEMMVQHRLSPYSPPVPIDDPQVGKYLGDTRVTGFVIPYSEDVATLKAGIERLRKGGWLSKGYFYVVDEPGRQDQYDELKRTTQKIRSIDPTLKVVTPTDRNPECLPGTSFWDGLAGITTIWCPITPLYDETAAYAKQAKGEEVWWYVCCTPGPPFPNYHINYDDGIAPRVLMWMQKLYNVQGLLYWNASYWVTTDDVWSDVATIKWIRSDIYGDGSLLYPGSKVGYDGPVSSIRLECIRDGMEDFEYLTLLEKKIGSDKTKALIRRVTTSKTEYVKDPRIVQRVRTEAARILSAR